MTPRQRSQKRRLFLKRMEHCTLPGNRHLVIGCMRMVERANLTRCQGGRHVKNVMYKLDEMMDHLDKGHDK